MSRCALRMGACLSVALGGCGGLSESDSGSATGSGTHTSMGEPNGGSKNETPVAPSVEPSDHFVQIAAVPRGFCGLTEGERDVVCFRDGRVTTRLDGPFRTFDADFSYGFETTCGLDDAGEIHCLGDAARRGGNYSALSAGTFNMCALTAEGRMDCWYPETFSGTKPLEGSGWTNLAVSFESACAWSGPGHYRCALGRTTFPEIEPSSSEALHFLDLDVGARAACGLVMAPAGWVPAQGDLVCFGEGLPHGTLAGPFTALSLAVDGPLCALDTAGFVRCFDQALEPVIVALDGPFESVSAAPGQVCGLRFDRVVECAAPSP